VTRHRQLWLHAPYWTDSVTAVFTPLDEVEWRPVNILNRGDDTYEHRFELPVPLTDWDVWDVWERERFHSMRDHLQPGMTLFDVGTEQGWCNLIYASFVGPENMVLIEPTPFFWPNIKAVWQRNYHAVAPRACYHGLLSPRTTDHNPGPFAPWPAAADGPLIDRSSYTHLDENLHNSPEMTLDDLAARTHTPDAVTIDVEGAELLVLQGAQGALSMLKPLVWVSIHPDLMERYDTTPGQLHMFMATLGYTGEHLATDHEEHWMFRPN